MIQHHYLLSPSKYHQITVNQFFQTYLSPWNAFILYLQGIMCFPTFYVITMSVQALNCTEWLTSLSLCKKNLLPMQIFVTVEISSSRIWKHWPPIFFFLTGERDDNHFALTLVSTEGVELFPMKIFQQGLNQVRFMRMNIVMNQENFLTEQSLSLRSYHILQMD